MTTLPLAKAQIMAASIVAALLPFAERIEIAGSIRRRRPHVNDIDLVILPKPNSIPALKHRCLETCRVITDGDTNFIVGLPNNFQLDIFLAARPGQQPDMFTPPNETNFGSLWLSRTGSREHNIYLVEHAKKIGLRWNPYWGIFGPDPKTGASVCLAGATEEAIFAALGLDFIPPEKRERPAFPNTGHDSPSPSGRGPG